MYVKPPTSNASRVKLPDNYGGSAFSSSYYGDMPPPARRPTPQRNEEAFSDAPKHNDIPPKSSPLANQLLDPHPDTVEPHVEDQYQSNVDNTVENSELNTPSYPHNETEENRQEQKSSSLLSSLIPSISPTKSFPFGHGIGGEELLILGVMLLIFLSGSESGEVDSEFIILLGLLLFAG